MPRWLSIHVLFAAALALGPSAAHAKCFGIGYATMPALILVVAHADGTADPFGQFIVIPTDLAGNPCGYEEVVIDFSRCEDVRICGDPVSCASGLKAVRAVTDDQGVARFTVMGSSTGPCGQAPSLSPCARIMVRGLTWRTPKVAILDLDGSAGVDANDLSVWLCDFASAQYRERGDYDGDGMLSANDVSIWMDAMGAGGSYQSVGTGGAPAPCP